MIFYLALIVFDIALRFAEQTRQFLLRGLEKMRGEWRLLCLTHNLLKLFQSRQAAIA